MIKIFVFPANESASVFDKSLNALFSSAIFSLLFICGWQSPAFSQQANAGFSDFQKNSAQTTAVSPRLERSLPFDSVVAAPGKSSGIGTNAPAADGDLDASFNAGVSEGGGYVEETLVQPDGKIIVGGSFIGVNAAPRSYLARLNADGSTDSTFNPGGSGPSGAILALARQPDGKILIGGNAILYNGALRGLVTRLNADGTPDARTRKL